MITDMLSYVNIKLILNKTAFVCNIHENIQTKSSHYENFLKTVTFITIFISVPYFLAKLYKLDSKIKHFCKCELLIIDGTGYLPIEKRR